MCYTYTDDGTKKVGVLHCMSQITALLPGFDLLKCLLRLKDVNEPRHSSFDLYKVQLNKISTWTVLTHVAHTGLDSNGVQIKVF